MNRVKKLVGGILAITLCVSVSAQTKLPPGWQSSYVKITPEGELAYYPDKQGNEAHGNNGNRLYKQLNVELILVIS